MGVYHFAPVGTSPGAVTSALAYLKRNESRPEFTVEGQIVESVVLFASPGVGRREERIPEDVFLNDYGSLAARRTWKKNSGVLEVIREFIEKEIAPVMPSKGAIYCCVVDPNNYEAGFETVARAALHFAPPESTGRNIWANLTGGTNVMNAALFQVAVLSGLISRLYYTFVAERRYVNYLQPPTTDSARFCWDEVPLFKTAVDEVYRAVLEELQEMNGAWCDGKELLTRLKSRAWGHLGQVQAQGIAAMEFQTFCQEFLNKLDGRELERRKLPDNTKMPEVRLSPRGKRLLEQLESPLYQALIQRGQGKKVEAADLTADLELEELWSKP